MRSYTAPGDRCTCRVQSTFHAGTADGVQLWRCSTCKHVGPWSEGFACYGCLSCLKCGQEPGIESVACASCYATARSPKRRSTKAVRA